jgi:hypothetical protein
MRIKITSKILVYAKKFGWTNFERYVGKYYDAELKEAFRHLMMIKDKRVYVVRTNEIVFLVPYDCAINVDKVLEILKSE